MGVRVLTFGGSRRTGGRWFRFLGVGLSLRSPAYRPSFGEEHGLRRALISVAGWRLYLLLPTGRGKVAARIA